MKYKDTVFGKMPENWNVSTIKEEADVVTDYVANGSFASLSENVIYRDEESDAILIRLVDYNNGFQGKFIYIDNHAYNFLSKSKLFGGEIIISNVGANVGTVFRCPKLSKKMSLGPNAIMVKFRHSDDFYYYWLKSYYGQRMLRSLVTGSAQPKFNKTNFREMSIPVPPVPIQIKIATILKSLDDKIELNNAINHNLQQQAASIFAQWLNTCAGYSTIGDMSHNILDYSPIASEQIRLLNSSDITEGVFPVAPLVPNKNLKGHFKKRFKFGDILYSEIRPRNHHYGLVLFDASNYIASTRLMVIRAIEDKVSPAMLYQYLLLPEVEAEFTAKTESRSGTFPQGNYADMASIQVPYSPTVLQTMVAETLSQIRYTIARNQFESQRLVELRDALLPKLMSGEIDVSAIEI